MKLTEFIELWNNQEISLNEFEPDNLDWIETQTKRDFVSTYGTTEKRELSISQLGKPFGFLLLDKLGIKNQMNITAQTQYHLMTGKMWESIILSLMWQYGVDIHMLQQEVDFNGIKGHVDCVYADNTVIDIKTMNAYYFKKFIEEPDDDKGYLTQIGCYQDALKCDYAGILCLNKWFGELAYVPINFRDTYTKDNIECKLAELVERASEIIYYYPEYSTHSLEDIVPAYIENIYCPEHKVSKKIMVPDLLKYDSRKDCVWNISKSGYIKSMYDTETICKNLRTCQLNHQH